MGARGEWNPAPCLPSEKPQLRSQLHTSSRKAGVSLPFLLIVATAFSFTHPQESSLREKYFVVYFFSPPTPTQIKKEAREAGLQTVWSLTMAVLVQCIGTLSDSMTSLEKKSLLAT